MPYQTDNGEQSTRPVSQTQPPRSSLPLLCARSSLGDGGKPLYSGTVTYEFSFGCRYTTRKTMRFCATFFTYHDQRSVFYFTIWAFKLFPTCHKSLRLTTETWCFLSIHVHRCSKICIGLFACRICCGGVCRCFPLVRHWGGNYLGQESGMQQMLVHCMSIPQGTRQWR